mgnify:CR=1 FL=1|tara:strand:- start:1059 stop:1703 length:645 start_codon:yes stop_codon:yes gene_type:complete
MRIRTVKPEFFVHAEIADLEREIGLPIRLAYIGLWCAADRDGKFKWTPRRLGVQILPYDNVDFEAIMDALEGAGFIEKYEVGDNTYGCVPSFPRHQVINNREVDSSIPSKDGTISPPTEDKQPTAKVEIKLPFESVEFGEAWNRWNDHRNDKKKKLTKGTAVMQLKKLEGIGEARAIKMIDHSISHGWMGLFEDQTSIPIPLQRKPQTSEQFSI